MADSPFDHRGTQIAIAVADFYPEITDNLLTAAVTTLAAGGVERDRLNIFRVPGAFELPWAVKQIIQDAKQVDAVIALGAVIRGETPHFDYICSECARGLQSLALDHLIPVLFGVLTTENHEQATIRSAPLSDTNKGSQVAEAALKMVETRSQIRNAYKMPL